LARKLQVVTLVVAVVAVRGVHICVMMFF